MPKHSDYERIELPEWFAPDGGKVWLLLYKDKPYMKVGTYNTTLRVSEVLNRAGGGHVFIQVTGQAVSEQPEDEESEAQG
ncbi:hypothetical protein U2F26_23915 [Micromonospora sp. 4G57]|uniref:Uncharacterized protein n=1 Tax=Micromonospora sicca TaxID=2202420 RepID=A0ABU5JGW7_9ACTN|nr:MULTISPECIES: hypothetical protein [unclassified Micromonospora]MDZ5445740.1 hypothetical protein [Micromonospora sp. 4G57]MDZ5491658.1 hypothetical protein [Micromonospora sp. 4G53]